MTALQHQSRRRRRNILPGFGPTMGYTLLYLSIVVLIPLGGLVLKSAEIGPAKFWRLATQDKEVIPAYELAFGASCLAALTNAFFGFVVAWTLVRIRFPGRRLVDAVVDMPFALPTAVSGIALATLFGPVGWIGKYTHAMGWKTAYSQTGVFIALVFIGLPFAVRTLQPALEDLDAEVEEAAMSLGATRWQTFWKVIFPALWPAVLTGFALSFARAVGEYGSVTFISGNIPFETKIPAQLIREDLEGNYYVSATVVAVVMLGFSFVMLLAVNLLQWWTGRKFRRAV